MKPYLLLCASLLSPGSFCGQTVQPTPAPTVTSSTLQSLLSTIPPLAAIHVNLTVTPPGNKTTYQTDVYVDANGNWRSVQHGTTGDRSDDTTSGDRLITEADGSNFRTDVPLYGLLDLFPLQVLGSQLNWKDRHSIEFLGSEQVLGQSLLHFRIGEQLPQPSAQKSTFLPRRDGNADIFIDPSSQQIAAILYYTRPLPSMRNLPKDCLDSSGKLLAVTKNLPNTKCVVAAYPPMLPVFVQFSSYQKSPVGLVPYAIDVSVEGVKRHFSINTIEIAH